MPTTTKPRVDHNAASNRLARGDVADFVEAVATFIAAVGNERAWHGGYQTPDHTGQDGVDWLAAEEIAAQRALAIYSDEMAHATRRTVTALRAAGLDAWADALETGSYERLAI